MPQSRFVTVLGRLAPIGIPLGMVLLPWGRVAACVGLMILSPFAVATVRLLIAIASELDAR